jgi:hypothetical protein
MLPTQIEKADDQAASAQSFRSRFCRAIGWAFVEFSRSYQPPYPEFSYNYRYPRNSREPTALGSRLEGFINSYALQSQSNYLTIAETMGGEVVFRIKIDGDIKTVITIGIEKPERLPQWHDELEKIIHEFEDGTGITHGPVYNVLRQRTNYDNVVNAQLAVIGLSLNDHAPRIIDGGATRPARGFERTVAPVSGQPNVVQIVRVKRFEL